jgi:hypothetical protein
VGRLSAWALSGGRLPVSGNTAVSGSTFKLSRHPKMAIEAAAQTSGTAIIAKINWSQCQRPCAMGPGTFTEAVATPVKALVADWEIEVVTRASVEILEAVGVMIAISTAEKLPSLFALEMTECIGSVDITFDVASEVDIETGVEVIVQVDKVV